MGSHVTGRTLIHIKRRAAGGIPGFWGGEWPGRRRARGAGSGGERPLRRGLRRPAVAPRRALPCLAAGALVVGTCGARGSMKVTSLDGRQLRKMLRKEAAARCVVLDCRPYLAFAASSVRGSFNVNLNSVVLRRARGGAVSARYVLPDEAARSRLLQEGGGGVAAVVVLDQGSRHWQKLREESAARVVLTSLLACLPAGPRVYFLKGERVGPPRPRRDSRALGCAPRAGRPPTPGPRGIAPRRSLRARVWRALGRALQASAPGASPSPAAFLESVWQPVCPPGWVSPVGLLGMPLSDLGAVGSCRARA